ncbi:MAG: tryptophan 7-halogenase [Myxococcales bacterium]|nr:tryptophan 7-halogenase [Myxococcales bacterium]
MGPPEIDLLVLGGGPAGATIAALAARGGLRTRVLEADAHPRVHVGESLLPGIVPILQAIGALEEVEAAGFGRKTGTTHFGWGTTPEWDLHFADTDLYDHAWLVDRARFDAILIDAARRAGAEVWEQAAAREPIWEGDRLVGVRLRRRGEEALEEVRARFVVDATGQAFFLARHLGLREVIPGLQHQAAWAHYEGAGALPPPREHQAVFVAEAGHWIWLFPLGGGRTSIGVISLDDEGAPGDERFDAVVAASPKIAALLGPGARRITPVRRQRDWSYRVREICGPGWLIAGDASGFIDPVLSTGVFLAMHAGYLAARALVSTLARGTDEAAALAGYERAHRELFADLLRMVRFYYQQTLSFDDYFWESKRIMMTADTELRPQKAFMILTSGLVRNLALDELQAAQAARQAGAIGGGGGGLDVHDPAELGFVCAELRHDDGDGRPAALYLLLEPRRPAEPALARTRNLQITCLAPRFGNDPLRDARLRGPLQGIIDRVRALDDQPGEALALYWRRRRGALVDHLRGLGPAFSLIRIFGE